MIKIFRLFTYLILLSLLTSCTHIFELDSDVQARQALFDLMEVQEKFYQDNNRYAGKLFEIEKYNFKYHTGIVYMEIEQADKDGYRAISLPAESTSARVFAFDSKQGGFYEMEDDEVSRYVLGALRQIREEKRKEELSDFTAWIMMAGMVFLGLRFISRYKNPENNSLLGAYLFCLFPLAWSIAVLGKMDKNIVFSSQISQLTWASLIVALASLILGGKWMISKKKEPPQPSLLSLMTCTLLIAFFGGGVMVYTLINYS
ncbi:MAG: hypothetical protein F3743_02360 [Nitrospinae bacterium]|nr:hypothetical protein [Nitrospinota bacterium]MZH04228.1 hypothetical protein [Nitrospinota bacterium]MZH14178.1 hypothetical protein [Nitrospinota bacterium]